jgi:zinc transporter ZupT
LPPSPRGSLPARWSQSEIIPETARDEHELATTFALLVGFLVMTSLDIGLG